MKDRVLEFQKIYLDEIDKYRDVKGPDKDIAWEKVHMASCGRIGYLLGQKRGVDPQLAAIACSVHDYGRVISGLQQGHAEAGYLPVKEFLEKTGMFTSGQIEDIALSVKNHSRKGETGSPLEEIVKDADLLDCSMYGYDFPRQEQRDRLERLLKDMEANDGRQL